MPSCGYAIGSLGSWFLVLGPWSTESITATRSLGASFPVPDLQAIASDVKMPQSLAERKTSRAKRTHYRGRVIT